MNHKISKQFVGFLVLFIFLCSNINAQKTITGKVVNKATNDPIQGASVQLKGTTSGTSSNQDGSFSFQVPANAAVLIISSVVSSLRKSP